MVRVHINNLVWPRKEKLWDHDLVALVMALAVSFEKFQTLDFFAGVFPERLGAFFF